MGRSFQGLPISLQAVVHLMEKLGHHPVTGPVVPGAATRRPVAARSCTSTAEAIPDPASPVPPKLPDPAPGSRPDRPSASAPPPFGGCAVGAPVSA
jgi:hypothetical protein